MLEGGSDLFEVDLQIQPWLGGGYPGRLISGNEKSQLFTWSKLFGFNLALPSPKKHIFCSLVKHLIFYCMQHPNSILTVKKRPKSLLQMSLLHLSFFVVWVCNVRGEALPHKKTLCCTWPSWIPGAHWNICCLICCKYLSYVTFLGGRCLLKYLLYLFVFYLLL